MRVSSFKVQVTVRTAHTGSVSPRPGSGTAGAKGQSQRLSTFCRAGHRRRQELSGGQNAQDRPGGQSTAVSAPPPAPVSVSCTASKGGGLEPSGSTAEQHKAGAPRGPMSTGHPWTGRAAPAAACAEAARSGPLQAACALPPWAGLSPDPLSRWEGASPALWPLPPRAQSAESPHGRASSTEKSEVEKQEANTANQGGNPSCRRHARGPTSNQQLPKSPGERAQPSSQALLQRPSSPGRGRDLSSQSASAQGRGPRPAKRHGCRAGLLGGI